MKVPVWAAEMAAAFWHEVSQEPAFPRDLGPAILWTLPLSVELLPELSIASATKWLAERNKPFAAVPGDRPLHGMLATTGGSGVIFLHASDDEAERRFSLAHELAHYLRDYRRPRTRVRKHLGDEGLGAFDGKREPTIDERIVGAVESLDLRCRVHILERDRDGRYSSGAVAEAERDADRLAFELLAPAQHLATVGLEGVPPQRWPITLHERYGFPPWAATRYSKLLSPSEPVDSLLASLRLSKGRR